MEEVEEEVEEEEVEEEEVEEVEEVEVEEVEKKQLCTDEVRKYDRDHHQKSKRKLMTSKKKLITS